VVYAEIVRLLLAHERVHILVNDAKAEARASAFSSAPAQCSIKSASLLPRTACGRAIRDRSSFAVPRARSRNELAFQCWAKYADWQLDDEVPARR